MKIESVLVLGGSGFIGRHVINALTANVIDVTAPTRHRERAKHLLLMPTVDVVEADLSAPGVLEKMVAGSQAVINLVGVLHSRPGREGSYGPQFARAHVELPKALVAACRAQGVQRLIHMSALGAAPDAPSEYLRSKAAGEQAVLGAGGLEVTVFRPSVVFGPEDRFLNMFAGLARLLPVMALACPDARFQPVYVRDVAQAILTALGDPASHGKRYDLCGPRVYTLRQLVEFVCQVTGRRRFIVGLSDGLSRLQARLLEWSPGPLMTRDNYRSMQVPSVCDCEFPFGIAPQAIEGVAPAYLAPSGPRQRYPQLRWRARR
jgi:NADH dehydrogenase